MYLKNNKKEKSKSFVARSSSARPEKVQKFLWEVEQKYVIEVQDQNNGKFNYYTKCVSDRNIRIENRRLKRFVERSSRAPPGEVRDL